MPAQQGLSTAQKITTDYLWLPATNPDTGAKRNFLLPLVHIYLKSDSGAEIGTDALIDSGANVTFIQYEIADIIGLVPKDVDKAQKGPVQVAGAVIDAIPIRVNTLKVIQNVTPFYTFRNISVLLIPQPNSIPYSVLGRDTIFKHFDITFCEKRGKMIFVRIP